MTEAQASALLESVAELVPMVEATGQLLGSVERLLGAVVLLLLAVVFVAWSRRS